MLNCNKIVELFCGNKCFTCPHIDFLTFFQFGAILWYFSSSSEEDFEIYENECFNDDFLKVPICHRTILMCRVYYLDKVPEFTVLKLEIFHRDFILVSCCKMSIYFPVTWVQVCFWTFPIAVIRHVSVDVTCSSLTTQRSSDCSNVDLLQRSRVLSITQLRKMFWVWEPNSAWLSRLVAILNRNECTSCGMHNEWSR